MIWADKVKKELKPKKQKSIKNSYMNKIEIVTATEKDCTIIVQMFKAYAEELNENLCFQSFDDELQNPFKKYKAPSGAILLAYLSQEPIGCVALQDITYAATSHQPANTINENTLPTCEMKRLYVKPAFRKHKAGEALVQSIIEAARIRSYNIMKLDTLERLKPAIELYLKKGFKVTNAYYPNPLPGVVYMEMTL